MSKAAAVIGVLVLMAGVGKIVSSESKGASPKSGTLISARTDTTPDPAARESAVKKETAGMCKGADGRAAKLSKAHPDWPPAGVALVACRRFSIGMGADQLRASLGKPDHVTSVEVANGTSEQWAYGDNLLIYVNDGVVTSIQQDK